MRKSLVAAATRVHDALSPRPRRKKYGKGCKYVDNNGTCPRERFKSRVTDLRILSPPSTRRAHAGHLLKVFFFFSFCCNCCLNRAVLYGGLSCFFPASPPWSYSKKYGWPLVQRGTNSPLFTEPTIISNADRWHVHAAYLRTHSNAFVVPSAFRSALLT